MAAEKVAQATGLLGWVDRRFPLISLYKAHLSEYYAPKNFNFWYFFGSLQYTSTRSSSRGDKMRGYIAAAII
jgi:hypothetical protein